MRVSIWGQWFGLMTRDAENGHEYDFQAIFRSERQSDLFNTGREIPFRNSVLWLGSCGPKCGGKID